MLRLCRTLSILSGKHKGRKLYAGPPASSGLPVAKDILPQWPVRKGYRPLTSCYGEPCSTEAQHVSNSGMVMPRLCFLLGGHLLPLDSDHPQKRGAMTFLLISPLLITILNTRAQWLNETSIQSKKKHILSKRIVKPYAGWGEDSPGGHGCRASGCGTGEGSVPHFEKTGNDSVFFVLFHHQHLVTAALTLKLHFLCDSW